jgi:glycerol-1-phosphate dehydrogenase [NAD(P)+]
VLHGAKVGLCSLLVAKLYAQLRRIDRPQMMSRLEAAVLPDRAADVQRIRDVYGEIAGSLIVEQAPFLDISSEELDRLKEHILTHWDEIQSLAAAVPTPQRLADLLNQAGGATSPAVLGLSDEEVQQALADSHYLRNCFTICKLGHIVDLNIIP